MASVKEMKELLLQYRAEGEERQVANLAFKLGDTYREKGKWDEALPLLEEALALCSKHGNPEGEAVVALSLAELHLGRADPGRAETLAKSALGFYREHEDSKGQVRASLLAGDTYWAREEYEGAIPYYEEALKPCKDQGDVMGSASVLDRLAKMYRLLNREEEALACFQESLGHWQELSVPDREAMTWTNMGDICKRRGDFSRAIRCHEQALNLYRHMKNPRAIEALEKELEELKGMQHEGAAKGGEGKSEGD
jgi:tetratricopeptide (TPR) repeat protein